MKEIGMKGAILHFWNTWLSRWQARARRRTGRLRLVDSLALGERRFAGILEIEGRRFLIGTTPQAVTLLGELVSTPEGTQREGIPQKESAA